MKLSQLSILFVVIMIILVVMTDVQTDNLTAVSAAKNDMDFYMDQAMESAAKALIQVDATGIETTDKDKAVDSFFSSMFASLGILSDPVSQERLRVYVPVIAVTTEDGYYLMYNDEYTGVDGYSYISRRWTEKMPYAYEDDSFIYRFTLSSDFSVYDKNNLLDSSGQVKMFELSALGIRSEDQYAGLRTQLDSNSFLLSEEDYLLVKQQTIISSIEKDLSWYVSRNNEIASRFGITYRLSLPVTDSSEWAKTLEGPGIIIIFQGMPLVEDTSKVYNRAGFSGAGVRKEQVYYIEQHGWYYVYHKVGCRLLKGNLNVREEQYYSAFQCIELGCYACEICDPKGVHAPNYTP